jgi:hypothetical protein
MKSRHLLLLAAAPSLIGASVVGCGDGGGFRAATWTGGSGTPTVAGGGGSSAGSAGSGGLVAGASFGGAESDGGDSGSAGLGGAGSGSGGALGGGPSGSGGSAAGTSGTSGVAGNGGAGAASGAGMANGGSSGAGGASGLGGAGAMSGAGAGGAGGTAGSAGTPTGGGAGTGSAVATCAERCNTDADCRVFTVDAGYRCNTGTHRCERFAEPCRAASECLPQASFWIFDCDSDADCFFFTDERCVDVGGIGRCARLAPSANGCGDQNPDEVTLPRFGTSGDVLVCANASLTCSEGRCVPGCAVDGDCSPARNGSVCDTSTGLCRCVRDQDCGGAGVSRCNTATGRCECTGATDCEEVPNSNACVAGRCGCGGVNACNVERRFSGTSYVCE